MGRLIAFDLDGTLIDSRRDLSDATNQLIVERGGTPLPEQAIAKMIGEGAKVLVDRALSAAGLEDRDGALARFLALYDERLLNHTRAYDGIAAAVAAARQHGRVAVLTNKPLAPSERILDGLGLRSLFDDVVGGDGAWPRKPDPSSLQELMRRASATPATSLLVGDSAIDHETAMRASVRCCMASYGFGFHTVPPQRLTGSEWIVSAPSELIDVFAEFTAA